jgi:hypothetical protein
MAEPEVLAFLTWLAVEKRVSHSAFPPSLPIGRQHVHRSRTSGRRSRTRADYVVEYCYRLACYVSTIAQIAYPTGDIAFGVNATENTKA